MDEVKKSTDLPVPLSSYLRFIEKRESPYYDLISHVILDMEASYVKSDRRDGIIYTINPRQLREEIDEKISSSKLTPINISRTIVALLRGSSLEEDDDWYKTTSAGGRKNYHIKITQPNLSKLQIRL